MEKLKNFQLKLHIDDIATRIKKTVHRLPYHTRAKNAGKLERLAKNDCLEKVQGSTTWISPIVIGPKHNGGIRMSL